MTEISNSSDFLVELIDIQPGEENSLDKCVEYEENQSVLIFSDLNESREGVPENDYEVEFIDEVSEAPDLIIDDTFDCIESVSLPDNHVDYQINEYGKSNIAKGLSLHVEPHAMVLRPGQLESNSDSFYCIKCSEEFQTLNDFKTAHKQRRSAIFSPINKNSKMKLDIKDELSEESEVLDNNEFYDSQSYIEDSESQEKLSQKLDSIDGPDNLFFCNDCQSLFDDIQSASKHICNGKLSFAKQKDTYFIHGDSGKDFNIKKSLLLHRFNKPSSILKSKRQQILEKATCTICNTTFNSEKNLKLHVKIHNKRRVRSIEDVLPPGVKNQYSDQDKFFCEICKKNFDQNLLTIHQAMHRSHDDHICGICNRQFENLPSFEMHMNVHKSKPAVIRGNRGQKRNPNKKLQFPCQYCGREFGRPHEKVRHERVHTGEKPYACEVCGKSFRVPYSLTLHLRTHTEIRPYVCPTCNKRFKSQPVYAHHLKTHLSERGYKCDICEKAFRTSVQLCAHKNSHIKPFSCSECSRPFASFYAVKIHMKTHSQSNKLHENLKFNCIICGASYARQFALRFHIKSQHSVELYEQHEIENQANINLNENSTASTLVATETNDDYSINQVIENGNVANVSDTIMDCGQYFTNHDTSAQSMLQTEEIIVDNFHTEEVVDSVWLSKC